MSIILDCETIDSTYNSLSNILELNRDEIQNFLSRIDIEEYYKNNPCHYCSADKLLLDEIIKNYKLKIKMDKVCWFHLARTMNNSNYINGIYPLGYYINDLWDNLYSLVKKEIDKGEWIKFKNKIENGYNDHFADLYRTKVKDKFYWGPYGMLVRDSAFSSKEMGNHDYLKVPEIVEDIGICFNKIYGINLVEKYICKSKSIIVKFISDDVKDYYVGIALNYLYNKLHNFKMSLDCNTCYDAKANIIHEQSIINIEEI